ncbi:MAG TPA: hypothetical protein VJO12_16680 [Stellaceae bacterium]|nr:hypothetical protein [Stellaceae bacterium]
MKFLVMPECEQLLSSAGLDHHEVSGGARLRKMRNAAFFFYDRPLTSARAAADRLVGYLGEFNWALLWIDGLVFGDRSLEKTPPDGWRRYARWRQSAGEARRIYNAPGHMFEPTERAGLTDLVELALTLAEWDAVLLARPNRCVIRLSHDELVAVQSHFNLTTLSRELTKLGFARRDFHEPRR